MGLTTHHGAHHPHELTTLEPTLTLRLTLCRPIWAAEPTLSLCPTLCRPDWAAAPTLTLGGGGGGCGRTVCSSPSCTLTDRNHYCVQLIELYAY